MTRTLEAQARTRGIDPANLTFTEPWQARAFALTFALADRGTFAWEQFRQRLIAAIASAPPSRDPASDYFTCWLSALEESISASGIAPAEEIQRSADDIAAHSPLPTKASRTGPIKIA